MNRSTALLTAPLLALALPATAQNFLTVQAGGTTITTYGHVNPLVRSYDNGIESKTQLLDNSASQSRLGVRTETGFDTGGGLTFNAETGLGLPGTSGFGINDSPEVDLNKQSIRKFELIWDSGRFGTFYLGQGSMASDGIAEFDFSGVAVTSYSSVADVGGGNLFALSDGTLSDVRVKDAYSNLDGSRRARLRYDTPKFGDVTLSLGYGQEALADNDDRTFADVALRYAREFGAMKVAGGIGYNSIDDDGVRDDFTSGSFALKHMPTGLNGSFAAGRNKAGESYAYIQAGVSRPWFDLGMTSLSVDYYDGKDFRSRDAASRSVALTAVQNFDRANTELYLTLRNYDYEETLASYQTGRAAALGFRTKF